VGSVAISATLVMRNTRVESRPSDVGASLAAAVRVHMHAERTSEDKGGLLYALRVCMFNMTWKKIGVGSVAAS
jgi:hypothetical protein